MARHKQCARKSTGGRAPRRQLATYAARNAPQPITPPPPPYNPFDHEALIRDYKVEAVQSAQSFFESLLGRLPGLKRSNSRMKVLDFGCGTGLVSQRLAMCDGVVAVVGVDTSEGMINEFNAKRVNILGGLKMQGFVVPMEEDVDESVLAGESFDIIVIHLVLHHLPDMVDTVRNLSDMLKDGGQIFLSDYENDGPHAKRFYSGGQGRDCVRHGLTEDEMRDILEQADLNDIRVKQSFGLVKKIDESSLSRPEIFPFLLGSGIR